jgi:hypothetical protein
MSSFEITLLEQDWLGTEPAQFDLCSHGRIRLIIGGQVILDGRENYGISESALALLRTLDHDHTPEQHLSDRLIFHGCGTVLMMGCPIGLDWSVLHHNGQVTIKNILRWDSPDEDRAQQFNGLEVRLTEAEYRQAIIEFAQQVIPFFEGQTKEFFDAQDRLSYEKFWAEFHTRVQAHTKPI